jgi:type II secretory pathway component GspD/PulD (secretin)
LGLDWIFGNSTNKASVIEAGSAKSLEATPSIAQDNQYRVDLLRTIGERAELTPEQFKALLARLEAQAGTELLTAPKVLTSSGRQTKVAVTETKTLVDDVKAVSGSSTNKAAVRCQTRSVDLGPSVEFLPILEGRFPAHASDGEGHRVPRIR